MEEKVLIKSEKYDFKQFFKVMMIIAIIALIIMFIIFAWSAFYDYCRVYWKHQLTEGQWRCVECKEVKEAGGWIPFVILNTQPYYLIPVPAFALIAEIIRRALRSCELTVTDKRIYGTIAWGKRVDLPVDSISATAKIGAFKGVSVSTSSGRINFRAIKNADAVYEAINNLLIERQQKNTPVAQVVVPTPLIDEVDQIKKYKELLDQGIITQEEFDAKKKQLLGL